ncbi:major facilitator superfamily transporter [Penicillium argentinense]|uniref:Major facilitator superfamily transporter n=1 Tax=Penicillium argentinense TaxID=1131581 RepID=A0A9W9ENY9_9EURO|nr:major facilitator superfamily transporter [Penicillium argentinense]KAJ5085328.1 major facilitator superfamily transporter [Penicillium argentinense]
MPGASPPISISPEKIDEIPATLVAHETKFETPQSQNHTGVNFRHKVDDVLLGVVNYTPRRCRWDPEKPFRFNWALTFLFAFSTTFTVCLSLFMGSVEIYPRNFTLPTLNPLLPTLIITKSNKVANLYYNTPLLTLLASTFNVSYERISQVPTVMQAGYAVGLVFLCPLGDLVRRRPFTLLLTAFTATVWLGLCLTRNFECFLTLSFVVAVSTVTPQIMLPLIGDIAPPSHRATAISLVSSGLLLGLLLARVLAGIVSQYTPWRTIYWIALALQWTITGLLWGFMPDYPATNSDLSYGQILLSILTLFFKTPSLVQACLMGFFFSAPYTSFWTSLTFLLSDTNGPYGYSTLIIGLFAFVGILPMALGPIYSRLILDRSVPLLSVLLGVAMCGVGAAVGVIGSYTIAGLVVQCVLLDLGQQVALTASRVAIYEAAPGARSRVNTAFVLFLFGGNIMGTAVGPMVFVKRGWVGVEIVSVVLVLLALGFCVYRGPREVGWVGWGGGWNWRRLSEKRVVRGRGDGGSGRLEEGRDGES